MKRNAVRASISAVLSVVMLIGSPILASETVEIQSSDYLLGQEGLLRGILADRDGKPVSGLPVFVLHENRVIAVAVSDEKGDFAVQGLKNGQHAVKLGHSQQSVRFWNNATAPPAAQARMAVVVDEEIVRSQSNEYCEDGSYRGQGGLGMGTTMTILVVGGAVATVLALTLNDKDSPAVVASP